MIKQRYNMEDLLTQLREKGIRSIEEVDYAVLETSGKLSVFKKDNKFLESIFNKFRTFFNCNIFYFFS